MFVTYSNDKEILICTLKNEHILLENYFGEGLRSLDDYDRDLIKEKVIEIRSDLKIEV